MSNIVSAVIVASLVASTQGRRIKRKSMASDSSMHLAEGHLNATGLVCPEGYGKFGFMEKVEELPEYLFAVFGEGLANAEDHQFMIWQAREKGSTTYGAKVSGTWYGLDYYFVKGPLCMARCSNSVPKCCIADKTLFPGTSNKTLAPHGNRPRNIAKAVILPSKWSATNQYSPSGLGVTFELVDKDGKLAAKAASEDGQDCFVKHVHVCESNLKGGRKFKPTTFDIVGVLGDSGEPCVIPHS
eukprot:gnl/MRDRNA2_/MRDRNA2_125704_c0_seq1.p1 gnl/MRDRNA2_/MRDRNA2_125704_c0~~gnl/MRDRNA2_/MRDRNA2_125704_c0_seq1.p1  ORF type:complete len:275 (-),score=44.97 gnl/MRDRNA2_/MRDRNA2_125704_c0_seq1:74-799(-)